MNYPSLMEGSPRPAKQVLAETLRSLMARHERLRNRQAIATASGVSDRTVGYMLKGEGNPTLDNIEAVAARFGLRAWELLIDRDAERQRLADFLLGDASRRTPSDPAAENGAATVLHQPRGDYQDKKP